MKRLTGTFVGLVLLALVASAQSQNCTAPEIVNPLDSSCAECADIDLDTPVYSNGDCVACPDG